MSPIPGGPGNPPPKKHKHPPPVTGHGHGHKSQSASGDPHPGGQHGGGVTGGHNNPGGTNPPSHGGSTYTPPAWVIRRQQVLRRAGYNIAVDGVWGSASQAAWNAFSSRINPAQHTVQQAIAHALPPGMVRLPNGKVVPLQVARQMHVVTMAQQQARKVPLGAALATHKDNSEHVSPRVLQQQRNHAEQRQAVRAANDAATQRINQLYGFDRNGLAHMGSGKQALHFNAKAGRVTPDDLRLLLDHGSLDPTNADDVKVIQETVNSHLPSGQHVKVDGQYGQATYAGMIRLWMNEEARRFRQTLHWTQKNLYDTHIAQNITKRLYGHAITDPGKLLAAINAGGPRAERLSVALARRFSLYKQQEALTSMLTTRSDALRYGGSFGSPFDSFLTTKMRRDDARFWISALGQTRLDKLLPQASITDLPELVRRWKTVQAEEQRIADAKARLAAQPHGFWQTALYDTGQVLNTAGGAVDAATLGGAGYVWNAMGVPGKAIEGSYFTLKAWGTQGLDNFVNDFGYVLANRQQIQQQIGGRSRLAYQLGNPPDNGWMTPEEAWEKGQLDYKSMPLLAQLAFDIITDPFTYVGPGVAKGFLRGAGFAGGLVAGRAAYRSAQLIDHARPFLNEALWAKLTTDAYRVSETLVAQDGSASLRLFLSESKAIKWTRSTKLYARATTTRAAARTAVNNGLRQAYITALRPISLSRGATKLAQVDADAIARSEALVALLDPATVDLYQRGALQISQALQENAPDLLDKLTAIPTSLYSTESRSMGALSVAGAEIHGRLYEAASRAILERYAIIEALAGDGVKIQGWLQRSLDELGTAELRAIYVQRNSPAKLSMLREALGTYRAGHVPLKWRDQYLVELNAVTERIEQHILPALDEMLRAKWGENLWLRDLAMGTSKLAGEASDEVRVLLDEFFGYSVRDAFKPKNWVSVKNPNFGVVVNEREMRELIDDEISRRQSSLTAYAERQKRLKPGTDHEQLDAWVFSQVSKAKREIRRAWKETPEGWTDTRETLRVPAPQARHVSPAEPAQLQLDELAGALVNGGRFRFPGDEAFLQASKEMYAVKLSGTADRWRDFADSVAEQAAIAKVNESALRGHLYKEQGLIHQGLKWSQARHEILRYRFLYAGIKSWKTATLLLRPAWRFLNTMDDLVKMVMNGFHDPRLLFKAGAFEIGGRSIFADFPMRPLIGLMGFFDRMFGTNVATAFRRLLLDFYKLSSDTIHSILGAHGIEVADRWLERIRLSDVDNIIIPDHLIGAHTKKAVDLHPNRDELIYGPTEANPKRLLPDGVHKIAEVAPVVTLHDWERKAVDFLWDAMANRPESIRRKALYLSKYRQELANGKSEWEAMKSAVETVEHVLFDYDKIPVLEENLSWFLPFINYTHFNTKFWATELARKPWFFITANKVYDAHLQSNDDQPEWMRRYVSLAPIANVTDLVPGLDGMGDYLRDAHIDPLTFVSVKRFYDAFKSANPDLKADQAGLPFISGMVDGLNAMGGLGINPYWNEALSRYGILTHQAWRDIFPLTSVTTSLTNLDWVRSHIINIGGPQGFNLEDAFLDPLFQHLPGAKYTNDQGWTLDKFNELVNREMAEQQLRGEKPNRAKAEAKVRGYTALQTLFGYFAAMYPKTISPENEAIHAISDLLRGIATNPNLSKKERDAQLLAQWYDLSPQEQEAYKLFKRRGMNPAAFDRYANSIEGIVAFYRLDDWQERQQFLQDNPDVRIYVDPTAMGQVPSEQWLQDQVLIARSDAVFQFTNTFLKGMGAPSDVRNAAFDALVTPSLLDFWRRNDTSQDLRDRHMAGQYFRYIDKVSQTYFGIPETDNAARNDYLNRHPELTDFWRVNDGATDDYRNVMQNVNATFRTIYFHFVDQGDWNSADEFLRRHPFIFDFTSAEGRIDPEGKWHPKSQQQRDYAKAAPDLRVYYSLPEKQRQEYANAHPLVGWFLTKYGSVGTPMIPGQSSYAPGGLTQHGLDYLKVAGLLDSYFKLSDSAAKARFLERHPELKAYFAKYSQERQTSQHARDYLAVKGLLDQFFSLPESERGAFVKRHPELQAYFDKYGSGRNGHSGSSYEAAVRTALAEHPDIAERYHFWQRLFALPPNKRAEFIHRHAAQAGIFIYGSLSYDARQLQEKRWHRQALRFGISDRSFLYQRIAPFLQFYFTLPAGGGERALFLQMNPDLQLYLDQYAGDGSSPTGNPHLDKLLEAYFLIPSFDPRRNQFLTDHPELSVYFNKDASPRERALQSAVDVYFKLPYGYARQEYLAKHPEVRLYFDQRKHEHDLFTSLAAAFNDSDPRMAAFKKMYEDIIPLDAIHLWFLEQKSKHTISQAPSRDQTGRQPEKPTRSTNLKKAGPLLTRRDRAGTSPPAT